MLSILELHIQSLWDERHWDVAMKSDKPLDVYNEIKENIRLAKNAIPIDELPAAERDWYRSTG